MYTRVTTIVTGGGGANTDNIRRARTLTGLTIWPLRNFQFTLALLFEGSDVILENMYLIWGM